MNNKKLIQDLCNASNTIHKQALKGSSNYMIVSHKIFEEYKNLDPEYRRMIRKQKLDKLNETTQIQIEKEK